MTGLNPILQIIKKVGLTPIVRFWRVLAMKYLVVFLTAVLVFTSVAFAQVSEAKARADEARKTYERQKELYAEGIISKAELETSQAALTTAENELSIAERNARSNTPQTYSAGTVRKNSIGMELVWIPAGTFMMGSTEAEVDDVVNQCKKVDGDFCGRIGFTLETPKHKVTISQGFLLGKFEVTQGQWQAVMGTNPSEFENCGSNCPVERVSWDDAQEFIKRLNAKNDGYEYRLPSEAEWEYACRAGTTAAFAFGDSLNSSQANFNGNYPHDSTKDQYLKKTVAVGSYRSNAWGLYDMHGNVWEWVEDIYNSNYQGVRSDGLANASVGDSTYRGLRGGGWYFTGVQSRSAFRFRLNPGNRNANLGFRVAARFK